MTTTTSSCSNVTANVIDDTYEGKPAGQASLLAGFGASLATATLFVAFAAIALPGAAFV